MADEGFAIVGGAEESFHCVQCGANFKESENGIGDCQFHLKPSSCCRSAPCGPRSKHRSVWHNDYQYATLLQRSSDVKGYTDTKEAIAEIEEADMEGGKTHYAGAYILYRWKSRASLLQEWPLLITVGGLWDGSYPFHFRAYTIQELQELKAPEGAKSVLIHRTHQDDGEFAQAEWLFGDGGAVNGVRLTCKAASNFQPTIIEAKFSLASGKIEKEGEPVTLQSGAFVEYGPEGGFEAYAAALPPPVFQGPRLETDARDRRVFRTKGDLGVRVVESSRNKLQCARSSRDSNGFGQDYFRGGLCAVNLLDESLVIMSVTAEYRLCGNPNWTPIKNFSVRNNLPAPCGSSNPLDIEYEFPIKNTVADTPNLEMRERSIMARFAPLRVRFTLESADERRATQVVEFVNPGPRLDTKNDDDAVFLFADNTTREDRVYVHCSVRGPGDVRVGNRSISADGLKALAYTACKTKQSEVVIENFCNEEDRSETKAWAVVDFACNRVVAIKVQLRRKDCGSGAQAFFAVGPYGEATPLKAPAIPAFNPEFPAPTVEEKEESKQEVVADDQFDDDDGSARVIKSKNGPNDTLASIDAKLGAILAAIQALAQAATALAAK